MELPLYHLNRVFHIGTLNVADLGKNSGSSSHEGNCLSVSLCPLAWRQIARLGGYPLHEMARDHAVFLDMHAARSDQALFTEVLAWGRKEGLIVEETRWKVWSTDEDGEWRYSYSVTEDDGLEEIEAEGWDDIETDGPDGGPLLESCLVPIATAKLAALTGGISAGQPFAEDFVLMAWAEKVLPSLAGHAVDGVWWHDDYDPASLSAPRGAIFPACVPLWESQSIDFHTGIDDEALSFSSEEHGLDEDDDIRPTHDEHGEEPKPRYYAHQTQGEFQIRDRETAAVADVADSYRAATERAIEMNASLATAPSTGM